jgi:Tfp pilus assembly protein PilO
MKFKIENPISTIFVWLMGSLLTSWFMGVALSQAILIAVLVVLLGLAFKAKRVKEEPASEQIIEGRPKASFKTRTSKAHKRPQQMWRKN